MFSSSHDQLIDNNKQVDSDEGSVFRVSNVSDAGGGFPYNRMSVRTLAMSVISLALILCASHK